MILNTHLEHLAAFGGVPVIPAGTVIPWPAPDEGHLEAIRSVLMSGHFHRINHPIVVELERKVAEWAGVSAARAVSSGTAAIHVLLDYHRIPESQVCVAALNWPGAVAPVFFAGMQPVFVDTTLDDGSIDNEELRRTIAGSRQISSVMLTHLFGNACIMSDTRAFLQDKDIAIVDDCAQAIASARRSSSVHIGTQGMRNVALSGNGSKHLGAGELGLVLSDAERITEHVDRVSLSSTLRQGEREFLPHTLAYNYRPNVFSAAIALSRMATIDDQLSFRRKNAQYLNAHLCDLEGLKRFFIPDNPDSSFCVFPLRLEPKEIDLPETSAVRDKVVALLKAEGLPVGVWMRKPVWEFLRYPLGNCDKPLAEEFPNTMRVLDTMFHVAEIAPPNGIQLMRVYVEVFHKVWEALPHLRDWFWFNSEDAD